MNNKYNKPKPIPNMSRQIAFMEAGDEKREYFYKVLMPKITEQRKKVREEIRKYKALLEEKRELMQEESALYTQTFDYVLDFDAKMKDEQIKFLLPVINKYVFVETQTVDSVRKWLRCENTEPVRVRDNAELCNLLNELRDNGFICGNAQMVAEENSTFVGRRGSVITQRNMTASLTKWYRARGESSTVGVMNAELHDVIERIKRG